LLGGPDGVIHRLTTTSGRQHCQTDARPSQRGKGSSPIHVVGEQVEHRARSDSHGVDLRRFDQRSSSRRKEWRGREWRGKEWRGKEWRSPVARRRLHVDVEFR